MSAVKQGWCHCSQLRLIHTFFSVAGFWLAERRKAWRARWRDWSMKAWRWTKHQGRCVFSKRRWVCLCRVNISIWLDWATLCVFGTWREEERAEINTMTVASQRGAQWPRRRRKTKMRMCLFYPAWTTTSSASNTSRYVTFNMHLLITIRKSGIHSKVLNVQQTKCFRIFMFYAVKIIIIVSTSGGTKPLQITPKFWVSPPKQVINLVTTCLVVASSSVIYDPHVLHSAMYVNEIIFGFIFTNWEVGNVAFCLHASLLQRHWMLLDWLRLLLLRTAAATPKPCKVHTVTCSLHTTGTYCLVKTVHLELWPSCSYIYRSISTKEKILTLECTASDLSNVCLLPRLCFIFMRRTVTYVLLSGVCCVGVWVRTARKACRLAYCKMQLDVVGHPDLFLAFCISHTSNWDIPNLVYHAVW